MQCHKCFAGSSIIAVTKRGFNLRECTNRHRWLTSMMEIRETDPTEPATQETVATMRDRGHSVRSIADALRMSTRTVQALTSGVKQRNEALNAVEKALKAKP